MARINTNIASLISQHNLARSNSDLQVRLERLSTGLQINSGSDGPAALIISERLRSEIEGITSAIGNAERAVNVIATAEAALNEVATLLNSIQGLIVEAANSGGMSREEIEANQLQIDDAIASITRISNVTNFAGLNLLDGSMDYVTSGVATSALADVAIHQANFGTADSLPISVEVITSAQTAGLYLSTGATTLTSSITLEIAGDRGVEVLQFVSGTALSSLVFAVNQVSDSTGVEATMVSGAAAGLSAISFVGQSFGSDSFISVRQLNTDAAFWQTFDAQGGSVYDRDTGEDVVALVNGQLALGDGSRVQLKTSTLDIEMHLTDAMAQTAASTSFSITGGGAVFQIGASVESSEQVSLGLQSVAASRLGDNEVGFLSSISSGGDNSLVAGRANQADRILDQAITQISVLRGRLGAFERNTLQTNVNSLQVALENVTASESQIRDADFAAETAELTRAQLLVNVGTSVLATSNNAAANVLQLLGG